MSSCFNSVWLELLPKGSLEALDQTRFLTACRSGLVTRRELEIYLIQQHHYSRHFTRYLCALLSNLTAEEDRLALTENLFEEMGLGGLGEKPHSQIYREMLAALGLDPEMMPPLPETSALVTAMHRLCANPEPMLGLGALCLGAEAIVPHIYSQILTGLMSRGFEPEHLTFFPLHIDGDDDHALTMKAIIDRELAKHPEKKAALVEAAKECIAKRAAFFTGVSAAARNIVEERATHAV
jgi:pyrroloquinoline quinone (PQQ) biosynthesis protein C